MNTNFKIFTAFVLGAAAGSVVVWKYAEKKYNTIIVEEINSLRGLKTKEAPIEPDEEVDIIETTPAVKVKNPLKYEDRLKKTNYTAYTKTIIPPVTPVEPEKEEEKKPMNEKAVIKEPYVVSPDDFGENKEYDVISLTYYADGVLADDQDSMIKDVNNTIGGSALSTFGQYEEDSVFVQNDKLNCYYEICRDTRRYSAVMRKKPYKVDEDDEE